MSKQILMDSEDREINELLDTYKKEFSVENFNGKTVVITGGAKGIGFNIARGLLHLGAKISIIDKLEVKSIAGTPVTYYPCELANHSELQTTIEKILENNEQIHGLINCAAEFPIFTIRDFNPELFDRTHQVNFKSPTLLINKLLPKLSNTGFVMNVLALEGLPFAGAYCSSKSANRAMMLSLAAEEQGNLAVFGFTPGVVYTDLAVDVYSEYAKITGLTLENFVRGNANNPGYEMMMPPQHCALAALLAINEANANHGLIAEPFAYLNKLGLITLDEETNKPIPSDGVINRYLQEIKNTGVYIENKIFERTMKINDEKEKISYLFDELKTNHEDISQLNEKLSNEIAEKDSYYRMLMRKSQTEALGEVAGNIAHEVNNPLLIIRSASQLLEKMIENDSVTPEKMQEKIKTIIDTTDRVSDVVKSVKVLSRDTEPEHRTEETVEGILKYVTSVIDNNVSRLNIDFESNIETDDDLILICKPIQISQVLVNLLSNAIDAVKNIENPKIKVLISESSQGVLFKVTNNGPQIPKSIRDKILNPFFTTKEQEGGTGLGLSISSRILLDHHSTLDFTSDADGTSFFFYLNDKKEYKKGA